MYISHLGTRKKNKKITFPRDRLQKIGSCPQAVSSGAEGPTRVPRFRLGLPRASVPFPAGVTAAAVMASVSGIIAPPLLVT